MTECWNARPVSLTYRLGEAPLFSVRLSSRVLDAHFTRLPEHPDPAGVPLELLDAGGAALVRSHPIREPLPRVSLLPGVVRYVPAQYTRHYVDLEGDFEGYLKKFSSKSRSTLGRKVRKFAEASGGEIDWREYRTGEELREFHRLARQVSERTYQENLLRSGLPEGEAFLRELDELASQDQARGYLLFHGGKPIAYLCCPAEADVLLYEYVGYDPEFQSASPGTVLQYLVLERLFAEGRFRILDFTEGEGPHKEFFATGSQLCADLYYFRRTPWNLALVYAHSGLHGLSRRAVSLLSRLGVKDRLKKWLRARSQ